MQPNKAPLCLAPEEVHVWWFGLDDAPSWEGLLSDEERQRAASYKFSHDRARFITGRGILRHLLGRYTGLDPVRLRFAVNAFGKPFLLENPIAFNISHSQGKLACAFATEGDIGIDIEKVIPLEELPRMVAAWFSPREQAEFAALPAVAQAEAFYHVWTQKEAFIKAQGKGLSLPLRDFSVEVNPAQPAGLPGMAGWKMYSLVPQPDFRLAVCIRQSQAGQEPALKYFDSD